MKVSDIQEQNRIHWEKMDSDPQYREIQNLRSDVARLNIELSIIRNIIFDEGYEQDIYYYDYGTELTDKIWEKFRK